MQHSTDGFVPRASVGKGAAVAGKGVAVGTAKGTDRIAKLSKLFATDSTKVLC